MSINNYNIKTTHQFKIVKLITKIYRSYNYNNKSVNFIIYYMREFFVHVIALSNELDKIRDF